jgi:hypothetical protein
VRLAEDAGEVADGIVLATLLPEDDPLFEVPVLDVACRADATPSL